MDNSRYSLSFNDQIECAATLCRSLLDLPSAGSSFKLTITRCQVASVLTEITCKGSLHFVVQSHAGRSNAAAKFRNSGHVKFAQNAQFYYLELKVLQQN